MCKTCDTHVIVHYCYNAGKLCEHAIVDGLEIKCVKSDTIVNHGNRPWITPIMYLDCPKFNK